VSMAGLSTLNCPDELQDPETESSTAGSQRWLAACELLLVPSISIAFYINLNPSRNRGHEGADFTHPRLRYALADAII
jgi:hypothetical protein